MKKTAHVGRDILFSLVNERDFHKAVRQIGKDDQQSADLLQDVGRKLMDEFNISRDAQEAFNRFRLVINHAGKWDIALLRNNIFKAAHSLGMKLPSMIFASDSDLSDSDLVFRWGATIRGQSWRRKSSSPTKNYG